MNKEEWYALPTETKIENIHVWIRELMSIAKGNHPLYNKKEQGKLCSIKKELEDNIFHAIEWENDKVK